MKRCETIYEMWDCGLLCYSSVLYPVTYISEEPVTSIRMEMKYVLPTHFNVDTHK